jgi:hypothetical protein
MRLYSTPTCCQSNPFENCIECWGTKINMKDTNACHHTDQSPVGDTEVTVFFKVRKIKPWLQI